MRLKLDENLSRNAAQALRRAGHDVATVPGQKLFGAEDGVLIETCHREGRCLVTLDLEFGNPLLFRPPDYPGIVVLRLPSRPTPQDLLDTLETLIAGLMREDVAGKALGRSARPDSGVSTGGELMRNPAGW